MESIGDKIRKVREEKGYSLDQVARDTHITRRFLEALEIEDFSSMPGESYVIGFLRSYTEYLGMNPEEIVNLYKNLKLQEQPAPMNELLERPKMPRTTLIGIVSIGVIVVVGLVVLGTTGANSNQAAATLTPKPVAENKAAAADVLEKSFVSGESASWTVNSVPVPITVLVKDDKVQLEVKGTKIDLQPLKTTALDLDQDGKLDVNVTVKEIDTKSNPAKAVLRLDKVFQTPGASPAPAASAVPAAAGGVPVGMTNQPSRIKAPVPVPEYTDLSAINATIRFEGSSVFRYETNDGKRSESLMRAGDTMTVSAAAWVRLWFSNSGKAVIKVGSREIRAGADGEIGAFVLNWATAGGNRQLELAPMY